MEYVYSRNFIEHFEMAGFEQIAYFIKALIQFIEKELESSPVRNVPTAITMEKFLDVERIPFEELLETVLRDEIPDAKTQTAILKYAALRAKK